MAAFDAPGRDDGVRWKWILPALCAITSVLVVATAFDIYGFGARSWLGYWDAQATATGSPFTAQLRQVVAGGAAASAGLRNGDRIDLRKLDSYGRSAVLFQPVAAKSIVLPVTRDGRAQTVKLTPSSVYDVNASLKIVSNGLWLAALFWALCCAWLIAIRRWQMTDARYLCLTLVAVTAGCITPMRLAVPSGIAAALQYFLTGIFGCASALLPVALSRRFGRPTLARRFMEIVVAVTAAFALAGTAATAIGVINASVDPLRFASGVGSQTLQFSYAAAIIVVCLAVAGTPQGERARAAWLLLPLPITLLAYYGLVLATYSAPSWVVNSVLVLVANIILLVGAAAVTFAVLARRVLDFEFVVGRALVAGGVSAVVVGAFILLEWLLGSVFAGLSHATGVVANAALALVLGLSIRFIHSRVDAFVDFVFFHKRREDERALRDFAREAAFVTTPDDLLNHAIQKIQLHTDARAASILVNGEQLYRVRRAFGDAAVDTSENDAAILALKATHKAVDLHRYATTLKGDIALPMLSRGGVAGVIVCGTRVGGEAYAPDEIEALTEFAQGVGSALESIGHIDASQTNGNAVLRELCMEVHSLRDAIIKLESLNRPNKD